MKKRIIFPLLVSLISLFLPLAVFAAGSAFVVSTDQEYRNGIRVLTLAATADDADGSIPDLTITATTWTDGTTSGTHSSLLGWSGYKVFIDGNHAGTEPTENSELYIYEGGLDLLDGNGVDAVDNTDERQLFFQIDGLAAPQPFVGDWTVTVTQQAAATASATVTVKVIFVKTP